MAMKYLRSFAVLQAHEYVFTSSSSAGKRVLIDGQQRGTTSMLGPMNRTRYTIKGNGANE